MSEEEVEVMDGWGVCRQKPLPLQRILLENNGQTQYNRSNSSSSSSSSSKSKLSPSSPKQSMYDKENVAFTKLNEKRHVSTSSSSSLSKELCETSELLSNEAMSSTLAVQQSTLCTPERLKPTLFSASNLSSISLIVNASGPASQDLMSSPLNENRLKTPTRRGEFSTNSVFRTPSTGSHKTPSSRGTRTPSSDSGPWSSTTPGSGVRYNPFESHHTTDVLHLPTLSPSIFHTVQSPSQEESVNGRFWSIEQQWELYPATIPEDSPFKQSVHPRNYKQDTDSKTQEQIDLYFTSYHDVTSPPDLPPTGPLLVDSPEANASYSGPDPGKSSKWTQTVLTLPPALPAPVEQVLRQYGLIMDVNDDPNVLSNSTLRRKLFNVDMFSDLDDSRPSSDDEKENSPHQMMTPGQVIRTPVTSKPGTTAQWSSSPLRGGGRLRMSQSPPDLHSPMFSPIAKEKKSSLRSPLEMSCLFEEKTADDDEKCDEEEDSDMLEPGKEKSISESERDTSELFKTAEVEDTELSLMVTDSNSGAAWGFTLPTLGDSSNNNTESRVDTGYTTNTVSSIQQPSNLQEDSVQPSQMDSGVSTSQQPGDNSVSLIFNQPPLVPTNPVLMSYGGPENDISVGFPLGSSTPTKR